MDKIIEVIKSTEAADEESLVAAMKARGAEQDDIDAAIAMGRVLGAYADVLTAEDVTAIAKSVDLKVELDDEDESEETATKSDDTDDSEEGEQVSKQDGEIQELREELAQLKAEKRLEELRKMAKEVKVGDQDEILETLKNIDEAGGDVNKTLTLLKSASAAVESALDSEIGSSAPGTPVEDGYDALRAEAQKIASAEGITIYKAMQKLQDTRPDFVKKHRANS